MEVKNIGIKDYALKFGSLNGGLVVVFAIMLYFLDMHYQGGTAVTLVNVVISIGTLMWGLIEYRKDNGGFISLTQALKVGMSIALIGSIIGIIYGIILSEVIDPDVMNKAFEFQKQQMLQSNPEMSVEQVDGMIEMQKKFSSPAIRSAFGLIFGLFFGFVVSLIGGLIVKRSRPE
jgi:hypothetical protein